MARRVSRRRVSRRRVSTTEYTSSWWMGFRAGVYQEEIAIGPVISNIQAIALGMEGGPIEQNSAAESQAYKRGYQKAVEFKALVKMGKFPDLEASLRGGSVIERAFETGASEIADIASDPLGELEELVGNLF